MGSKHGQQDTRKASADTRYLEKHQGLWRVVVAAPRPSTGRLKRSLGTASLREAQRLRWPIVAELKASANGAQGMAAARTDEAEAWKAALAASTGGRDDQVRHALSDHLDALRGDPIATEEDENGSPLYLYDPERERRAVELADRVYGRATQLTEHLSAFLASRGQLKEDTKVRHEAAVGALSGWLKRERLPQTIQALSRRVAIQYVDQLPPGRPDPKRLSLYWQWLVKREHVPSDPWSGLQVIPRVRVEPERAWTDEEVQRLLEGPCSPSLSLLMQVAALSGARLDAIVNMTIEDGCFVFPPQKKEEKARRVPIHSSLRSHSALKTYGHWSWPASPSQAFTYYRRKVLGEDAPGRRRAVTNFHSFRRWFISKAEQAGIDERIISDVVGHKRRSMTGRYSAGATMEQMRVCVEAVKLPT
jgi:integrase